jgi:hypothetical protein
MRFVLAGIVFVVLRGRIILFPQFLVVEVLFEVLLAVFVPHEVWHRLCYVVTVTLRAVENFFVFAQLRTRDFFGVLGYGLCLLALKLGRGRFLL